MLDDVPPPPGGVPLQRFAIAREVQTISTVNMGCGYEIRG